MRKKICCLTKLLVFFSIIFITLPSQAHAESSQLILYYSSQSSPLSKNVLEYIQTRKDELNHLILFDVATNSDGWEIAEKALKEPCGVSGVPILIEKTTSPESVKCHTSDVGVIERLKTITSSQTDKAALKFECSALTECVVSKRKYENSGKWKTLWTKSTAPTQLCHGSTNASHTLSLESDLGLALGVLEAPIGAKKYFVNADLYSGKISFVLASFKTDTAATTLEATYRMTPKSKEIINIECH